MAHHQNKQSKRVTEKQARREPQRGPGKHSPQTSLRGPSGEKIFWIFF